MNQKFNVGDYIYTLANNAIARHQVIRVERKEISFLLLDGQPSEPTTEYTYYVSDWQNMPTYRILPEQWYASIQDLTLGLVEKYNDAVSGEEAIAEASPEPVTFP